MRVVLFLFLFFTLLGFALTAHLLVRKKGDVLQNRILAAFTFLFALELLNNCLRWGGWIQWRWLVHFNLMHFPFWTAYGPLVYLYARRAMTGKGLRISDLVFALPPLVMVGLLWDFYLLDGPAKREVMANGLVGDYILFPSYGIWVVIPIMVFYAFLTLYRFGPQKVPQWRKNRWLKWFAGSYLGFTLAFAAYIVLVRTGLMDPSYDYLIDLAIVGFIGLLAGFAYFQPELFQGRGPRSVPFVKYRNTGLSPLLARDLADKLQHLMEAEQPYLHPDLRLEDLAGRLGVSRNQASQIINEHFNRSFFDFINEYRVGAARQMLIEMEPGEATIAQIAFEAGFNTRASFYKAFRKFAGATPAEYLNNAGPRVG